jgi:hypothetical protein
MCPRWWRVLTDIYQVQQPRGSRLLVCALPCICEACAILLAVCVCQCKVLKGSHEFLFVAGLWYVLFLFCSPTAIPLDALSASIQTGV